MKYVKKIIEHDIPGLLEVELDPFRDYRGEIWSSYEQCDLFPKFVEDKISISTKNVLRGLHGDYETGKLISCIHGEIFLAVVDIREEKNTVKTFILSDKNPRLIFVPPGCLNGHLCLTNKCIFFYKWTARYKGPESQITVKWNDPTFNIPWPLGSPILSERDLNAEVFRGQDAK